MSDNRITMQDEFVLTTMQVAKATGISYRQCDYWHRLGAFREYATLSEGSGIPRRWKPTVIPILEVIAELNYGMRTYTGGRGLASSVELVKKIVEAYPNGELVLGPNVKITWPVK
jgi:hypothetical protein